MTRGSEYEVKFKPDYQLEADAGLYKWKRDDWNEKT
jgi:hypothetical protein